MYSWSEGRQLGDFGDTYKQPKSPKLQSSSSFDLSFYSFESDEKAANWNERNESKLKNDELEAEVIFGYTIFEHPNKKKLKHYVG